MRFKIKFANKDGEVTHTEEVTAAKLRDAVNDLLGPTNSDIWKTGVVSVSVEGLQVAHHTEAQTDERKVG